MRPMTWGGGEGKVNEAKYVAGPGVREKEKISLTDYKKKVLIAFQRGTGKSVRVAANTKAKPGKACRASPSVPRKRR